MKFLLLLSALVAVVLASADTSVQYEAAYYPSEPATIDINPNLKVVNGNNAVRNQIPYQISLQRRLLISYSHICGGSIISPRWILTAAHCVSGASASNLRIVAGILLQTDQNVVGQQTRQVSQVIMHALYPGGNQVAPNDIALLRLNNDLIYAVNVQPIGVPRANYHAQGDVVLSGWGLTNSGGSSPNHLQFVEIPVVEENECKRILDSFIRNNPFSVELNVCSGIRYGGESACNGDSGGPLVQHGKVVGVVSWGLTPCGAVNAPSVYAKVAAYAAWIEENTNRQVTPQ